MIDTRNGETVHQLFVEDSYFGAERKWEAARDPQGRPLRFTAISKDEHVAIVSLLETRTSGAQTGGEFKGTPVIAGDVYLGFELPLSESQVRDDTVRFILPRKS